MTLAVIDYDMETNRGDVMLFSRPVGLRYVDRGDPASKDFQTGDFIKDALWHDLDVSGILPAGVELAFIRFTGNAGGTASTFMLRPKGMVNSKNIVGFISPKENQGWTADSQIRLPSDRILQYWASSITWTQLDILFSGWFV